MIIDAAPNYDPRNLENKWFILRQNAGRDYGDNGDVWITFKGMGILLREGATVCLARLSVK